ncbi:unnamed protein product [Enterobius vermicularis]|uniref:Rx_N domain-containing protein n=1 Tax=Enterobius vermicularis TaxID=51028 RepID=A0A0N4VFI2_ENTVE|nr:unnamed protein product [Enterobius vermicularis]
MAVGMTRVLRELWRVVLVNESALWGRAVGNEECEMGVAEEMWQDISEFLSDEKFKIDDAIQGWDAALSPLTTARINNQHSCSLQLCNEGSL